MSRVAVTGAGGLLGRELVRALWGAGHEVLPLTHREIDLLDPSSLERITAARPNIVVNAAAWTDVDGCAGDPDLAQRINGDGAGHVAASAAAAGALAVQISTNEVFDGVRDEPYAEEDAPNPINPYGASKLAGEEQVARATDRHLVIRTAWLFGPDRGFPARIRAAAERAMAADQPLRVVEDEWGNPTPVGPLAEAIVLTIERIGPGSGPRILHLAGEPPTSRLGWARNVLADLAVELEPIPGAAYDRPSRVPPRAVLTMSRARALGIPGMDWRTTPSEVIR